MSIRTYIKEECRSTWVGSDPLLDNQYDWVCDYTETPIIDLNLAPEKISENWRAETPVPSAKNVAVIFPELHLLKVYESYKDGTWQFSVSLDENDYVELVVRAGKRFDNVQFDDVTKRNFNFQIRYKNFNQLPQGGFSTDIKLKAEVWKNGVKTVVEEKKIPISIKKTDSSTPEPPTALRVLNMTYNNVTKELTGDTRITFGGSDLSPFYRVQHPFTNENVEKIINFDKPVLNYGMFDLHLENGFLHKTLVFSLSENFKATGILSGFDFSQVGSQKGDSQKTWFFDTKRNHFEIVLNVIGDATAFEINKKEFRYELFREEKSKAQGQFVIKNPNRLQFSFSQSPFLKITNITGNQTQQVTVSFESNLSDTFRTGEHNGHIKVSSSAGTEQVIAVILHIKQNIDFSTKEVYFCLDKDSIKIRKSHADSEFARAEIQMQFSGFGKEFTSVQQYDYVFFEDYVTIDAGDEVQDFFEDIPSLEVLNVNEHKILSPKEIFKATRVNITVTETNFKGETFKTYSFKELYYLPGKKPEAFPFLTRSTLRSTYTHSLISVSALVRDVRDKHLGQIASNLTDLSNIKDPLGVANFTFRRSLANQTYEASGIITKEMLSLEPKPEPNGMLIDAIFQNQNFCPDWFSFAGEYETIINFEHTIADNVLKSEDYKAFVKSKRTFKLNTGWLFPEEVELLWELIKSPLCYLKINKKWIKVIPISQKPLSFDSERNLHSMQVEFQLAEKE